MKILISLLVSVCLGVSASAQKVFFIYLQTEDNIPFYAKMSDKVYTSTSSGYLTLSNLTDSTYQITIGFPSLQEDSKFNIPLKGKDRGFLIRHPDNNLVLYDIETSSIIKPLPDPSKVNISYEKRTDEFTALLSKASGDSSLLYIPIAVKSEVNTKGSEPPQTVALKSEEAKSKTEVQRTKSEERADNSNSFLKSDTVVSTISKPKTENNHVDTVLEAKIEKQPEVKQDITRQQPVIDSPVISHTITYKKSKVIRYSESSTSEGFGLVFFDEGEENTDTIRLTIPNPKIQFREPDSETKQNSRQFLDITNKTTVQGKAEQQTANETITPKKDTIPADSVKKGETGNHIASIIKPVKSTCSNIATS